MGIWKRIEKETEEVNLYWYECSNCGDKPPRNEFGKEWFSPYCPNCGMKMEMVEGDIEKDAPDIMY